MLVVLSLYFTLINYFMVVMTDYVTTFIQRDQVIFRIVEVKIKLLDSPT